MKRASGFTLIEIVVAVAILATAMAAIIQGMARHADNAGRIRDKTIALWVAHNRLTEVMLEPGFPSIGRSDGDMEMAGLEWRWEMAVIETPDPEVRRIDIRIYKPKEKQDTTALVAFVSSAGRTGG